MEAMISKAAQSVVANSDLAKGCTVIGDKENEKDKSKNNGKEKNNDETNTSQPSNSANTSVAPNSVEFYGGLSIGGPATIYEGDGVSYTACDGAGKPYVAGGTFVWNHTRQDLMSLAKSGSTASGVGFKEGAVTIILKYDGMTAYLDVKIKKKTPAEGAEDTSDTKKKPPIFESSGGTENKKKPPLFESAGGVDITDLSDENENCSDCDEDQVTFGEDPVCGEIRELLINAINNHDTSQAELLRDSATALGCNLNVAAVDGYIKNVKQQQYANHQAMAEKERRRQQAIRNSQNIANIFNQLNNIRNSKNKHHPTRKPSRSSSHSHSNSTKPNFDKLKNFGNATKKGSW